MQPLMVPHSLDRTVQNVDNDGVPGLSLKISTIVIVGKQIFQLKLFHEISLNLLNFILIKV